MKTNSKILAADFTYLESDNLSEVLAWLSQYREQAKVLAGGTDLLVKMKTGSVSCSCIIYLKKLTELVHISQNSCLTIGSMTTLRDIEQSSVIKEGYSALFEAVRSMAAVAVKNMGTIGGNLCNGSPAADTAPALLVHDAEVKLVKQGSDRIVPIDEFFLAPGKTAKADDELLTEIRIPLPKDGWGSSFLKLGRVAADIAKINVAVSLVRSGNTIAQCRIAFGSVALTPIRLKETEALLAGQEFSLSLVEEAARQASGLIKPITDNRSTSNYRSKVSRVMLEEALKAAWQRTGGEL